jgi:hypothetical protein
MQKQTPKTKEEARQYAMDFQDWVSKEDISYGDLDYWWGVFSDLGIEFNLTEEFKENGII